MMGLRETASRSWCRRRRGTVGEARQIDEKNSELPSVSAPGRGPSLDSAIRRRKSCHRPVCRHFSPWGGRGQAEVE